MLIKDLFPENERVDTTVYVVQHNDNEYSNTIIECRVNAELSIYATGGKHLWGTLRPAAKFNRGNDMQVFRLSNDPTSTGGGMKPKDFDKMLNSDGFHFYDYYVYTTKEAAENHVKCIIENKVAELEQQLKNIKHINYVYYC